MKRAHARRDRKNEPDGLRFTPARIALMAVGGVLMIGGLVFISGHMTDRQIFTIGIPAIVAGIVCFAIGSRVHG